MMPNDELEMELFELAQNCHGDTQKLILQAIARLRSQAACIADLEARNTDMGWRLNPDRMGGQYTDAERNRRNEWR